MCDYRILIVEDDPRFSSHLESLILDRVSADVLVSASVADAANALAMPLDFAFLDVDVLDGKTYELASTLSSNGIPFAFVSASDRTAIPSPLRDAPFIAKPYWEIDVLGLLRSGVRSA